MKASTVKAKPFPECQHNVPLDTMCQKCWESAEVNKHPANDSVNHPKHYNVHPSGIEAILITEHMNFCLGNAVKYIWRADLKGGIEDLRKAVWYLEREIQRRAKREDK